MSTRSAATVRAKRAEQPFTRQPTGPATSINSQQMFNSGGNTTGANARINGPNGSSKSVATTNSSPSHDPLNPAAGSKLTIGNAIALITLRLGRVESFMHQYNLEGQGHGQGQSYGEEGHSENDELMQMVLSRLTALEHSATVAATVAPATASSVLKPVDSGSNQLIQNRMTGLEQTVLTSSEDIVSLKDISSSINSELKETRDLLLKLQSFTMETNTRLVNTIFCPDENGFNIHEFEPQDDYGVGFNQMPDEYFTEELENGGEMHGDFLIQGASHVSANLKDLINQELLSAL